MAIKQQTMALLAISLTIVFGRVDAEGETRFRKHQIDDRIQNTSCEVGPDGHLYVLSMNYHARTGGAALTRYQLDSQGRPQNSTDVVIQWDEDSKAQPIGLAFDPDATAQNPVAWIALGESLQGHSGWSDPWAGRVYRAELPPVGSSDSAQLELKITNLPHAFHTVNDIRFGPDRKLYICCGSATTLGWEPHTTEQLLSGAILQADVGSISGTLDVKTADGGTFNPFAADAPVKLFATAIRQAYDCTWHPNGRLYACTNQNDVNGQTGSGGGVPNIRNEKPPEFLAVIERGKTYGFPNAARGEFVLMGGNPTASDDGWTEIDDYPVGVKPPDSFDKQLLHRIDNIDGGSANGILSYRASGSLHQHLICCFYNDDKIYTFALGENGFVKDQAPLKDNDGSRLSIEDPLDICEHPTSGHLYVAAYGHQDKGEQGGVYFLERQSEAESPVFRVQPNALIGSLHSQDDLWSDRISVTPNENIGDFTAEPLNDWLESRQESERDGHAAAFRVDLVRRLDPGTHYGAIRIDDGRGHHRNVGVQIHVPDQDQEQWFAVSAGNSRDVTPDKLPIELRLDGTVMSAANPEIIELRWEQVSGPSDGVDISEPQAEKTTATFEKRGRYQLRLVAEHADRSRQQTATFVIDEPGNDPPRVDVEANRDHVALGSTVSLIADANDDGRPKSIGQLSYRWSREGTGNGIVDFSDPHAAKTEASFTHEGLYRIRCTVSDGVRRAHSEVIIEVQGKAKS